MEHRRQSVQESLNDFQDLLEIEASESKRRRNSLELLSTLEEMQLSSRLSQLFDECREDLQNDDQSVQQNQLLTANGSLSRRGSLNHEQEKQHRGHFEDFASLQRAISCESVCSDTSVQLNDLETANEEEAPVVGLICVALELDR